MVREGYYEATLGTLLGSSTALVELTAGRVRGVTTRGADLDGVYRMDETRRMVMFEIDVQMPAQFIGVTGIATGDAPRTVRIRGEAAPTPDVLRLSCCMAGRAIDIAMRYIGPVYETSPDAGASEPCRDTFFSATS